eukprot:2743724-Prymnesium_polylepis.1
MRAKAEGGDAGAVFNLGLWSEDGKHGLEKDAAAAYGWYKRGVDLGDASCLWQAGVCLADGVGVEKDTTYGMVRVMQAAGLGSAGAALILGNSFYHRVRGLPKDLVQAKA